MGQEVSQLVRDVDQEIERMNRQSSGVRNASNPFERVYPQGQTSSPSAGINKRFTDSQKSLIRNAIRQVHEIADEDTSPSEYEECLYESLTKEFRNHTCLLNPEVGENLIPDVVVKGVGVFEVKSRTWGNINSTEKGRILSCMKKLSLPGVLVNFPTNGIPYVRWYIIDEGEPEFECAENIELRSSAVQRSVLSQQSSSALSTAGQRSIQTQQSSSGLSTGAAVGIGFGVLAAAAAAAFAFSEAEGRQRRNSTDEE